MTHFKMDGQATVVLEFFCAVVNGNTGAPADELVIGAFVYILEPAPAAHVVDEDAIEVRSPDCTS